MRRLVLVVVSALLCAPAGAEASTVSVDSCGGAKYCAPEVVVRAEPGEANSIRVTVDASGVLVSDAGAALVASTGCSAVDASTARCESVSSVTVAAGDGDDRVELDGETSAGLSGGVGNDVLIGGGDEDWLDGGTGTDRLVGAGGDDALSDGDRRGTADADVLDGGPGVDVVDYASRTARVRVWLDPKGNDDRAGEAGEGDRLVAVEGAWGGRADDVLRAGAGGASPSTFDLVDGDVPGLAGGPGDDVLLGGRGGDRIDASVGTDRVRAGAGHDEVFLPYRRARAGARVNCGAGYDLVGYARPSDRLRRDCDRIYVGEYEAAFVRAPASTGGILVRQVEWRIRVAVVVDGGRFDGRLIARRTFRDHGGRLRLTALGRRMARRQALPSVRVRCRIGGRRCGFRLTAAELVSQKASDRRSSPAGGHAGGQDRQPLGRSLGFGAPRANPRGLRSTAWIAPSSAMPEEGLEPPTRGL